MAKYNNSLTSSQRSAQKASSYLRKSNPNSFYTELSPSKPFTPFVEKPEPSVWENNEGNEAVDGWVNTTKQLYRAFIAGDKMEKVKEFIKIELSQKTGVETKYEIGFSVGWDGEVQINYAMPKGYPVLGAKSNQMGNYQENIIIITPTPDRFYSDLDESLKKVEDKLNQEQEIEKFEKESLGLLEKFSERMKEYRDPPSNEDMDYIGRTA